MNFFLLLNKQIKYNHVSIFFGGGGNHISFFVTQRKRIIQEKVHPLVERSRLKSL